MVRSRIGSHVRRSSPAYEDAAETDALPESTGRVSPLVHSPSDRRGVLRGSGVRAFVFEIVLPWMRRTARDVALGAIVALGGCGSQEIAIEGVVRDGRTGEPIAGAHITTEDGRTVETDADGRFSVAADRGERIVASASERCDAASFATARPMTLRLFDRLDVDGEATGDFGAEVRIEVRARCDEGATIEWRQIGGPALGPDQWRVEEGGRALVVRTHSIDELVRIDREGTRASGEYGFEGRLPGTRRHVRVRSELPRDARWIGRARSGRARGGWLYAVHSRGVDADAGTPRVGCDSCHEGGDGWRASDNCAECHASDEHDLLREWTESAMSAPPRTDRAECARCHDGRAFVAHRRGDRIDSHERAAITCATCHDAHDSTSPRGLRVFDRALVAGMPAEDLGSGAICASCHAAEAESRDSAMHAPQAAVLLGRGARSAPASEGGAHRFVVDTCVRCHMTRGSAGGHTFSVSIDSGCAPCHGDVPRDAIGARDWDGDGRAGGVASEHARAIDRESARVRARVASLAITDRCGRVAADLIERDARLVLVDESGAALGDCDGDGTIAPDEASVPLDALPDALVDAAHDLALLQSDGSEGVHNPEYAFRVLAAVSAQLR